MVDGDIFVSRIFCVLGDQVSINNLHWIVSGSVDPVPSANTIAQTLDTAFAPVFKACMSASATYRGVQVQKIRPLPVELAAFTAANAGVGTVAGDALPRQASGIITKQTALAGRANRGRVYIPFPGEASSDAVGVPTTAYMTALTALAVVIIDTIDFVGGGGNQTWTPVLFHRGQGTSHPLLNVLPRQKWATQRRRGSYGRPNVLPF